MRPLFWSQVGVPRAEGQAIGLADGGVFHDANPERQIANHAADNRALLKVLLAENRDVGFDDGEEFEHDGANPPKVPRPTRAAEDSRNAFFLHESGKIRRIHLSGGRVKDQVRPMCGAQAPVGWERAGIPRKVFLRAKLCRINKYTDDDEPFPASEPSGAVDERGMPGVERAHGRNEHDPSTSPSAKAAESGDGAGDFQGEVSRILTFAGERKPVAIAARRGRSIFLPREALCRARGAFFAENSRSHQNSHPLMRSKNAFTLVEIMIVISIIALLAAIAVPNFLRARKRAQATRILDDLRLIDGALDLYAMEGSKSPGEPATWEDLQPYLKKNIMLYNSSGIDLLGNAFNGGAFSVDSVPRIHTTSFTALSDIAPADFWSPFSP